MCQGRGQLAVRGVEGVGFREWLVGGSQLPPGKGPAHKGPEQLPGLCSPGLCV